MLLTSCGADSSSKLDSSVDDTDDDSSTASTLGDITTFKTSPTDQFIVDMADISDGHMYRGKNATSPHSGAHVHFDKTAWPKDGVDSLENYPPIYAVANGIIDNVDTYFPVTGHLRYGLGLKIASSGVNNMSLHYSIEPFIDPEDDTFYEPYILVEEGDTVTKGQVIARMYISESGSSPHIHFNLYRKKPDGSSDFVAPVLFTADIMTAFEEAISTENGGVRNYDGEKIPENWLGDCMGYKIQADENPFESVASECLK